MKRIATAVSLSLGLSSATAGAQVLPNDMQGTDTLSEFMHGLLLDLDLAEPEIRYVGGGSGAAATAMRNSANRQELAPMSRFLNTSECTDAQGIAGVRGCFIIGADAVTIYGNNDQACGTLAYDQQLDALDLNGIPGIQGRPSTTFDDWRTVLRILYFGQNDAGNNTTDSIPVRCDSDLRRTLVAEWGNLFKGGCATGLCPTGLKHAYRDHDLSGTTTVFLQLLGITGGGVNAAPAPPFCNGTDTEDLDPIRRPCEGTGLNGNGDAVCRFFATPSDGAVGDYNLGVVLPVLAVPDGFGEVDPVLGDLANVNCNSAGPGAFGDLPWSAFERAKYGALCPNGSFMRGGTCKFPKRAGSGTAYAGFGCVASSFNRPLGSPTPDFDGRIYNLFSRASNGDMITMPFGALPRANASFFRIEQRSGCQSGDATDQIGCLTSRQACSLGFAARGVDLPAGSAPAQAIQEIGLRSKAPPFVSTLPTAVDSLTYPLMRDLYICRLDNFSNTGAQPAAFVSAQNIIRIALEAADPAIVRNRVALSGFVPTAAGEPLPFHGCTPP